MFSCVTSGFMVYGLGLFFAGLVLGLHRGAQGAASATLLEVGASVILLKKYDFSALTEMEAQEARVRNRVLDEVYLHLKQLRQRVRETSPSGEDL